ncbi:MAG: hypothetical protein HRU13_13030 [Phycisphaerales bacterium]|nr:hypothetical protein [Phycisphaerales bacterium]
MNTDPNYASDKLPDPLAGKLYEAFEPWFKSDDDMAPFNQMVDAVAEELDYQKKQSIAHGRSGALLHVRECVELEEIHRRRPSGYPPQWWYGAVLSTISLYASNDLWSKRPHKFWDAVHEQYKLNERVRGEAAHA